MQLTLSIYKGWHDLFYKSRFCSSHIWGKYSHLHTSHPVLLRWFMVIHACHLLLSSWASMILKVHFQNKFSRKVLVVMGSFLCWAVDWYICLLQLSIAAERGRPQWEGQLRQKKKKMEWGVKNAGLQYFVSFIIKVEISCKSRFFFKFIYFVIAIKICPRYLPSMGRTL